MRSNVVTMEPLNARGWRNYYYDKVLKKCSNKSYTVGNKRNFAQARHLATKWRKAKTKEIMGKYKKLKVSKIP